MDERDKSAGAEKRDGGRAAREAAALRANLARRKAQQRRRRDAEPTSDPAPPDPAGKDG